MSATSAGRVATVETRPRPRALVLLPNIISACRLAATPVLLYTAIARRPLFFAWLLLACLLSDIADGLIARTFQLQSRIGAALDSTADFLVTIIAGVGIVRMQWRFVVDHAWQLELLLGLFLGEVAISLWRYHRLSSFHTYLVRLGAYAQGVFFLSLFFWGYQAWLYYVMWVIACLGHAEEWVILALLPEWTHDVRGLYWVLKARRS